MTDLDLFNSAVYWAQKRAHYRSRAVDGHQTLTCRQCLRRARQAEGHIMVIARAAERRAHSQAGVSA